ncbi:FecR family protein [Chitinophaga rhizophila]|uniref:FecR domain-containing protein n=1 Tax=Chitinophaga rhizophila TaxID=2866212 RepID=A0ABS7G8W5_9BACT|nr:FecR family protein [Chitinophaga rhizophila]MBW8684099.1 FecR domain-containing protein [Chitinophaga rhizophila]
MNKGRLSTAQLKVVLNKYMQGTATPEEIRAIGEWYDSFGQDEKVLLPEEREVLRTQVVTDIVDKLQVAALPKKRRTYRWRHIAAVLAGVIAAGTWLLWKNPGKQQQIQPDQVVATAAGDRKTIRLSDGTAIHLNAGSRVSISGDYGEERRLVKLSGEAFFEIAPDAAHPFQIQSDSIITTVLGTSFNIRAYPGQEEWQIAVASGKVKVMDAASQQILADTLTANRALSCNRLTNKVTVSDINTNMTGAWRNNIFYFNNSSISEIAAELERQYNIKVSVHGSGQEQGHYQISFSREPVDKVLKVLAGLTGITYKIQPDSIIIYTQKTH